MYEGNRNDFLGALGSLGTLGALCSLGAFAFSFLLTCVCCSERTVTISINSSTMLEVSIISFCIFCDFENNGASTKVPAGPVQEFFGDSRMLFYALSY